MTDAYHAVEWEIFIVRVWREASSGAWRGEIVHVPDRTAIHFASFAQVEEFMRRYVPAADSDSSQEETSHAQSINLPNDFG